MIPSFLNIFVFFHVGRWIYLTHHRRDQSISPPRSQTRETEIFQDAHTLERTHFPKTRTEKSNNISKKIATLKHHKPTMSYYKPAIDRYRPRDTAPCISFTSIVPRTLDMTPYTHRETASCMPSPASVRNAAAFLPPSHPQGNFIPSYESSS
jgi:hypothetical protein